MYRTVFPKLQGLCKITTCLTHAYSSLDKITVVLFLCHNRHRPLSSQCFRQPEQLRGADQSLCVLLTRNHRKAGACSDVIARGPATTNELVLHLQEVKSLKRTGIKRKNNQIIMVLVF